MHKPNIAALMQEVHSQRSSTGQSGLDNTQRAQINDDVQETLRYIASQPNLRAAHEALTPAQVNASIRHYATEIAEGQTFPDKDPHLKDLLSTAPAVETSAPGSSVHLSDFLRIRENFAKFRRTVKDLAAAKGEPDGKRAAQWLSPQLDDPASVNKLLAVFDKMGVTTSNERQTTDFTDTDNGTKEFLKLVKGTPRKRLDDIVVTDANSSTVKKMLNPANPNALVNRRTAMLTMGAALGLGGAGLNYAGNRQSANASEKATKRTDRPVDDGDFLSDDAEATARSAPVQAEREAAKAKGNWSVPVMAAGATVAAAAAPYQLKASWRVRTHAYREDIRDVLTDMDRLLEIARTNARDGGRA